MTLRKLVFLAYIVHILNTGVALLEKPSILTRSNRVARSSALCTPAERQRIFNGCLLSFGMQYLAQFSYLAINAPVCKSREVFTCRSIDRMLRCIEFQPADVISDTCWPGVKSIITETFGRYGVPCTYADVLDQCSSTVKDLPTVDLRPKASLRPSVQSGQQLLTTYLMLGGSGNFKF